MRTAFFNSAIVILFFLTACAKPPNDDTVKQQIDKVINRIKDGDEKATEFERTIHRLDLNGDGVEDVVAFFTIEGYGGGNSTTSHMTVLISKTFGSTELGTVSIGSTPVKPFRFKDGVIEIDELVNGPNDYGCCPTQNQVERYTVVDEVKEILEPAPISGDSIEKVAEASAPAPDSDPPAAQSSTESQKGLEISGARSQSVSQEVANKTDPNPVSIQFAGPCTNAPIVVKKLCIGMPTSDAITLMESQLGEKLLISGSLNADAKVISGDMDTLAERPQVELDGKNGALASFVFRTGTISKLFNAADMSPEKFAQEFVNAYSIGNMPGTTQDVFYARQWLTVRKWTYRYDDAGVALELMGVDGISMKHIKVVGVVKASERSFN